MVESTVQIQHVTIYTDGACSGNPGTGGYGVVLVYGAKRREMSGGFRLTTNNRMELMAAIIGLSELRHRCAVTLYTDSRYLVDAMEEGWAMQWRKNGWKRSQGGRAANPDLWARLLDLCAGHQVSFEWVKAHNDDPENQRCDRLAVAAALGSTLPADVGYEDSKSPPTTLDLGL